MDPSTGLRRVPPGSGEVPRTETCKLLRRGKDRTAALAENGGEERRAACEGESGKHGWRRDAEPSR